MQISGTFEAGCLSNTHAHVLRSRIRETGYRGNAVSSSVKNSVGERHRIERDTEKWREGRSGSRSRAKDRSGIEWRLDGNAGDILKTDECRHTFSSHGACSVSLESWDAVFLDTLDNKNIPFGDLQWYQFLELLLLRLPHHIQMKPNFSSFEWIISSYNEERARTHTHTDTDTCAQVLTRALRLTGYSRCLVCVFES